jgi:hypothetical protein
VNINADNHPGKLAAGYIAASNVKMIRKMKYHDQDTGLAEKVKTSRTYKRYPGEIQKFIDQLTGLIQARKYMDAGTLLEKVKAEIDKQPGTRETKVRDQLYLHSLLMDHSYDGASKEDKEEMFTGYLGLLAKIEEAQERANLLRSLKDVYPAERDLIEAIKAAETGGAQ